MSFPNDPIFSQPTKKIKISINESITKLEQNQSEPSLREYDRNSIHSANMLSPSKSELAIQSMLSLSESKKKGITWSLFEDELLKKAVDQHSGKNWKEICKYVPGRTSSQCSQRWRRIQPYKNRQPWTKEEDKLLADLTQKFGCNWSLISSIIDGRTGKQVRERYMNKLDPKIDRSKFREEEDLKIVKLYKELGPKWRDISKSFIGRPENMIKNRFYSYIKKKQFNLDLDLSFKIEKEEEKENHDFEDKPEKFKIEENTFSQKEIEDIQSKFDLLLNQSERNQSSDQKPMSLMIESEVKDKFSKLFLSKEKEISTEYTFNMGSNPLASQQDVGKIEDQFVNNFGTKFLLNTNEEKNLDMLFFEKNSDNINNFQEIGKFQSPNNNDQQFNPAFNFEQEDPNDQSKWERMTFLNKKKEIIETMLANVLNKIQECEFNKDYNKSKN